jgi:diguanylate cyclase (GGDEF)-like protein
LNKLDLLDDRRAHLSFKLSIISIVLVATVFTIFASFTLNHYTQIIGQERKEQLLAITNAAVAGLGSLNITDARTSERVLDEIAGSSSDIQAVVLYSAGESGEAQEVARNTGALLASSAAINAPSLNALQPGHPYYGELKVTNGRTMVYTTALIQSRGGAQAMLAIYAKGVPAATVERYAMLTYAEALIAIIALCGFLFVVHKKEVFTPLSKLLACAREATGNSAGIPNNMVYDEFGELSYELNLMACELFSNREEKQRLLTELREKQHEVEVKSSTDFLTGLENDRSFLEKLDIEINRASRAEQTVSLLLCDIDVFKAFNEENGRILGDRALLDVAKLIKKLIRDYDVAARYDGEGFAAIVNDTDASVAYSVGERIRKAIEAHEFTACEGTAQLTISIGIATYPTDAVRKDLLIGAAEFALEQARKNGGNKTAVFTNVGASASA